MADPAAITLGEAITFLGPLIGAGGITAIVVAFFGSRKPSSGEPSATQSASAGIGAILSDSTSINRMAEELRRLTDSIEQASRSIDRACDLMGISQAMNRLRPRK